MSYSYEIKQQGYAWACPRCGKVNAPWISQCPCPPFMHETTGDPPPKVSPYDIDVTATVTSPMIKFVTSESFWNGLFGPWGMKQ